MKPKKNNDSSKVERATITIDVKKEIIVKHESGVRVCDLATQFGIAKSTVCTILKNREIIMNANVARGVTVITKQRSQAIEMMEKLLLIWINDNMLAGISVSKDMIREKARCLHDDLVKIYSSTDVFKASRGWFENFKKRIGIHRVSRHGEAANANQKAADEFVQEFSDVPTSMIHGICAKWDEVQSFVERYHPDKAVANRSVSVFNNNAMCHFRKILKRREKHKQLTLDNFLVRKRPSGSEAESSGTKIQKTIHPGED